MHAIEVVAFPYRPGIGAVSARSSEPARTASVGDTPKKTGSNRGRQRPLDQPQPQAPPQQPPPAGDRTAVAVPVMATVDSNFTVSWWPKGQVAGSFAALIGRVSSNTAVSPALAQARQRNS
jgi:hypothetical protein